jgi:hypothetical protein
VAQREEHLGRRRIARGADGQVDDATGERLGERYQPIEAVVRVRRRDETGGIVHGITILPDHRGSRRVHDEFGKATNGRVGEAGAYSHTVGVVEGGDDLAFTMDRCQHVAPLVRHHQLDDGSDGAEPIAQHVQEVFDALACLGAEGHRALVARLQVGGDRGDVGLATPAAGTDKSSISAAPRTARSNLRSGAQ